MLIGSTGNGLTDHTRDRYSRVPLRRLRRGRFQSSSASSAAMRDSSSRARQIAAA
jgi:hypothetical protein